MRKPNLLLFCLTFFSGCLSFAAFNAPSSITDQCKQFVTTIEETYNYGWLKVAETPENRNQISIFYYYSKKATLKDPVILFNGGPGSDSHANFMSYENFKIKYSVNRKAEIDFIFMDQRGTGCSTAFPAGLDSRIAEKLKWYGSAGIVRDAEAIRKVLIGDRPWKIFGQSFGGLVVHRYIEMYPESISKAFAHGMAIGNSDFDASYARIASIVSVLESYYKIYPADRNRLMVLNKYLSDKTRCFPKDKVQVCGFEILYPLITKIGFRFHWESLHRDIEKLVPNNFISEENISTFVKQIPQSADYHSKIVVDSNYIESHIVALNFIGIYDSNTTPMDYDKCLAIYQKLEKELKIKVGESLLDVCKAPFQFNYPDQITPIILRQIQVSDSDYVQLDKVKDNLIKHKISFYLYSGELDSFVPKALFKKEVSAFGTNVKYTNFAGSGHEGFMTEPLVLRNLSE